MSEPVKKNSITKDALKIASLYAAVSALWIISSDLLLSKIYDFSVFVHFAMIKGLLFVLVTSILTFYAYKKFFKTIYLSKEQLRISEKKFSAAFYKSPQLLIITRLSDSKIIEINDTFVKTTGFLREEIIDKKSTELVIWLNEEEKNDFVGYHNSSIADLREVHLRIKSGDVKIFNINYSTIYLDNDTYILCTLTDITDKKLAENKILKLNRFYSFISEVNQAIIRNHDTTMLFNEICRITIEHGKFRMVWIGLVDTASNDIIPVAEGGYVEGYFSKVRTSVKDEPEGNGMTGTAIKTGRFCIVNDTATDPKFDNCRQDALTRNYRSAVAFPIFKNNIAAGAFTMYSSEPYYFNDEEICLLEDVASNISYALGNIEIEKALRQSEARLTSFLNSSDIFMTIIEKVNDDFVLTWPNQYVIDFIGKSREEIKNKTASELGLSGDAINFLVAALKECSIKKHNISFEYFLHSKDNTKKWYLGDLNLIEENPNNKSKFSLAAIDITKLKEAEEKLIASKEKAMEADRLKSEFLAQISHEIRSPINVILNYISLIKDEIRETINDDLRYSFTAIDNSARRLIRTIDLILNVAQVQTGQIELKPRMVDIYREILYPLTTEFSSGAAAKGLELTIQKATNTCSIKIDEYTTSNIFVNLIDNALKYTPEGSIQIRVYRNDIGLLCVDVKDTGIGISEEFLDDLFTPFTQEEGGYTRRFEGNGLGLALVKNYCELNNADINVKSKKGSGTTFTVVFKDVIL